MPFDDDTPQPPRPRWLGPVLILAVIVVVSGMLTVGWCTLQAGHNDGKTTMNMDIPAVTTGTPRPTPLATVAVLEVGRIAVEGAQCIRCHGLDRRYVGPAFQQVAARYQGRPDAVDYLAGKIRNGGAGEWGRALMPRHPQLSDEQARQMAQWVLSLPPARDEIAR